MLPGMRMVRAIAIGVAMLIASPFAAIEGAADAQVWKPKSRQKKPKATTEAKSVSTKNRKAKSSKVKRSPKKKKAPVAKKKKRQVKPPPVESDDDEFTIVEEDWPDED